MNGETASTAPDRSRAALGPDARGCLGRALRALYEGSIDRLPLPDHQVDLLLRLRHKERERNRTTG